MTDKRPTIQSEIREHLLFWAFATEVLVVIFMAWWNWPTVQELWFKSVNAGQTIPKLLNYQARVTDSGGVAVPDGALNVKISVYDAASGGTCLYTIRGACGAATSKSVTVTNGIFSTQIGDTVAGDNAIPDTLFDNAGVYLGITVGADPDEMTPRKRLTAGPYAFNADRLDNLDSSNAGGNGAYIPATDSTGGLLLTGLLRTAGQVVSPTSNLFQVQNSIDSARYFVVSATGITTVANSTAAGPIGLNLTLTHSPASSAHTIEGAFFQAKTSPSNATAITEIVAFDSQSTLQGSGSATTIWGVISKAVNNGTNNATFGIGVTGFPAVISSGNITKGIGLYANTPLQLGTGVFTNLYGVYIEPQTLGSLTNYAVFYNNGLNGFYVTGKGDVGLGNATPSARLTLSASTTSPTSNLFEIQNSINSARYFSVSATATTMFSSSASGTLEVVGDIVSKGAAWTARAAASTNAWRSVAYGNGLFVAVSTDGVGNRVMTSPDGLNWTSRTSAADNIWFSVAYGNGLFVAVANSGVGNRVMTSPDGVTWTSRVSAADNTWNSVSYGNGTFVAVSSDGTNRVMTSPDGVTWTSRSAAAANLWNSVTYGNGLFVAVSSSGTGDRVMTSPDGVTWTSRTSAADNTWLSVTYGNGTFVAVSSDGTNRVMTSPDGVTWTSRSAAAANSWRSVTYGGGLFVAVSASGTGNRVMTSPNGIAWTSRTSAADTGWLGITYGNGAFAAVAGSGAVNSAMTSGRIETIPFSANNIFQGGMSIFGNAVIGSASNTSVITPNAWFAGNLTPTIDNTYSLGDYNRRWKDLWLSGGSAHVALDTSGSSTLRIGFDSTFGSRAQLKTPTTLPIQITTGSNVGLNVGPTGSVGIGTTSPRQLLSLGSNLDIYSGSANSPTQPSIRGSTVGNLVMQGTGVGSVYMSFDSGTGGVLFGNGASTVVGTVNSSGYATFGSASDLAGTTYALYTNGKPANLNGDGTYSAFMMNGKVGIGNSTPNALLTVGIATGFSPLTDVLASFGRNGSGENTMLLVGTQDSANDAGIIIGTSTVGDDAAIFMDESDARKLKFATSDSAGSDSGRTTDTRLTIDQSGMVGIGTTAPANRLHVNGAATTEWIRIQSTASGTAGAFDMYSSGTGGFQPGTVGFNTIGSVPVLFSVAGSEKMRVHSDGNVGIGATVPINKLHVQGSGSAFYPLRLQSTSDLQVGMVFTKVGREWLLGIDGANTGGDDFFIYDNTASAFRLRFDSSGRVGVGTTLTPAGFLNVESSLANTVPVLSVSGTTAATPASFQWTPLANERAAIFSGASGSSSYADIVLSTNQAETSGNVLGVYAFGQPQSGKTNPDGFSGIKASITGFATGSGGGAYGFGGALTFNTRADNSTMGERMRIDNAGNVGIGTAAPSARLTVAAGLVTPTTNIFEVQNSINSSRYFSVSSTSTRITGDLFLTGTCTGCGGSLNDAYLSSTGSPEINLTPSFGGLTIQDTVGGIGENLFEVLNNNAAGAYTRYFTVSSTSTNIVNSLGTNGGVLRLQNTNGSAPSTSSVLDIAGPAGGFGSSGYLFRVNNDGVFGDTTPSLAVKDVGGVSRVTMNTATPNTILTINPFTTGNVSNDVLISQTSSNNILALQGDLGSALVIEDTFGTDRLTIQATGAIIGKTGGGNLSLNSNTNGQISYSAGTGTFPSHDFFGVGINQTDSDRDFARFAVSLLPSSSSTMNGRIVRIQPTINYASGGAGSYEALSIGAIETALPSGTSYLIRAAAGASGTTDKFTVQNNGNTRVFGNLTVDGTCTGCSSASGFVNGGNTFGGTATLGTNDSTNLEFETNNLVRMTIENTGNIGIGQPSPLYFIHAQKDQASATLMTITNANSAGIAGFNAQNDTGAGLGLVALGTTEGSGFANFGRVRADGGLAGLLLASSGTDPIVLQNNNLERLRIDGSGNVGINTSVPGARLTVADGSVVPTGNIFQVGNSIDSARYLTVSSTSTRFGLTPAGTAISGYALGLGVANPISQFHVSGSMPSDAAGTVSIGDNPNGLFVQGRYAYVVNASASNTLQVVDVSNSAVPVSVGASTACASGSVTSVYVQGRYAYITCTGNPGTFRVFDVSNPASPALTGSLTVGDNPGSIHVEGSYAYVLNAVGDSLQIVDISRPSTPVSTGTIATGDLPNGLFVQGRYAYVVNYTSNTLQIFDILNPASPMLVSSVSTGGSSNPDAVYVQGRYAYVVTDTSLVLQVYDVANPASPTSVGSVSTGGEPVDVFVQGRYAYVANYGSNTLQSFDVSSPTSPISVGSVSTGASSNPWAVSVQGRYAYVINQSTDALKTFDVGGSYIQQFEAGGIETGTLSIRNLMQAGAGVFMGGVGIGQSLHINGDLSASGTAQVAKLIVTGDILPATALSFASASSTATVDTGTSNSSSIVIGTDGFPVISTFDVDNGNLMVIKCGNAACSSGNTTTTIDSTNTVGQYSSIAIGTDGFPVISYYYASSADLKVVKCGNAACSSGNTITTVDSTDGVGDYTSIAIATDGFPIISYHDATGTALKVAKCSNAACTSSTLSTIDTTGDSGWYTSIAVGGDGLPVISYYDATNTDLRVAKCFDYACTLAFTPTLVDGASANVGPFSSLVIAPDALPVISYYDYTSTQLKVVKCGNVACSAGNTITTIDSGSNDNSAQTSIAIGADGLPIVSYYYGGWADLKVIKCGNALCNAQNAVWTADSSGNSTGTGNALAIGTDTMPVIVYTDLSAPDLKVKVCGDASCDSSGGAPTDGADLGSIGKYFDNVFANSFWGKQFQIEGFDLAESYRVDDRSISAGDLVIISASSTGLRPTVEKSRRPYQAVVGVVSTKPGIKLSDWTTSPDGRLVALTGRVPTKVTDANGPILPNDPITASSIPGVGMKSTEAGAVVGYALEAWSGPGEGVIEIFINPTYSLGAPSIAGIETGPELTVGGPEIEDFHGAVLGGVAAILSPSGLWKVTEDGYLIAQRVEAKTVMAEEFKAVRSDDGETTGEGVIQGGRESAVIHNASITTTSRIFVSFRANPNSADWIDEVVEGGFTLRLAAPAPKDLPFIYWILNVEDRRSAPVPTAEPAVAPAPAPAEPAVPVVDSGSSTPQVFEATTSEADPPPPPDPETGG
jgi:hypothetical protein